MRKDFENLQPRAPENGDRMQSTPPVIAHITSGLGNQLFQYAAAAHCAKLHNRPVLVDTSWFDYFQLHRPSRAYRLGLLGLTGANRESRKGPLRWLQGLACTNQKQLRKLAQRLLMFNQLRFINESRQYEPCSEILHELPTTPILLNGYWQVQHHAAAVLEEMRRDILSNWRFSAGAYMWKNQIEDCPTAIFVHIRRGDYEQHGVPLLGRTYYESGAKEILRNHPSSEFFLFSEDQEWSKSNISFSRRIHFVEYDSLNKDIEDLLLMSMCKGAIIANSTFSWWGAALSRATFPIVAPDRWTHPESPVPHKLYMPSWQVIPN